ncbi:MAG: hypothetical protein IPN17_32020 [Deltaproteobacteria bacterium]|nr:hypothetical protein [Deltaproteobacteria bacterium]
MGGQRGLPYRQRLPAGLGDHHRARDPRRDAAHPGQPLRRRRAGRRRAGGDEPRDRRHARAGGRRDGGGVRGRRAGARPERGGSDPAARRRGRRLARVNVLDGVRAYFRNGDVAHLRPSGNAPQLRIYANRASQERADDRGPRGAQPGRDPPRAGRLRVERRRADRARLRGTASSDSSRG